MLQVALNILCSEDDMIIFKSSLFVHLNKQFFFNFFNWTRDPYFVTFDLRISNRSQFLATPCNHINGNCSIENSIIFSIYGTVPEEKKCSLTTAINVFAVVEEKL